MYIEGAFQTMHVSNSQIITLDQKVESMKNVSDFNFPNDT